MDWLSQAELVLIGWLLGILTCLIILMFIPAEFWYCLAQQIAKWW